MAIYGLMIEALLPVKLGADTEPLAVVVPPLRDADAEKLCVCPEPPPTDSDGDAFACAETP